MNRRKHSIFNLMWPLVVLAMVFNVSMAQDDIEAAPLVPITIQNAKQLEQWIPLDQHSQQAKDWIPMIRGIINNVGYSPANHIVAVGASTGLYLFDGNNLNKDPFHVDGIDEAIGTVVFSTDGTKIALKTPSEKLYVYSLSAQEVIRLPLVPSTDRYSSVQFGDDSAHVYAAAYGENYRIAEWDTETGRRTSMVELPDVSRYVESYRSRAWVGMVVTEDKFITCHPLALELSNNTSVVQIWD
jgi:WD40 repeat protein